VAFGRMVRVYFDDGGVRHMSGVLVLSVGLVVCISLTDEAGVRLPIASVRNLRMNRRLLRFVRALS
jgi:hypothetical protein